MKFTSHFLTLMLVLAVLGCSQSDRKKAIVYDEDNPQQEEPKPEEILPDTNSIVVANLPIHFDTSSNYLIHGIGRHTFKERGRKTYFGSASYSGNSASDFAVVWQNGYTGSGDLYNLLFEHLETGDITRLTEQNIRIQTFHFLYNINQKNAEKRELLLMNVIDKDSNKDQKLNSSDIESLYLYDMVDQTFQKLTPDMQELLDWKIIDAQETLYFKTIEDANKDGKMGKKDVIHYFKMNLNSPKFVAEEYNPI